MGNMSNMSDVKYKWSLFNTVSTVRCGVNRTEVNSWSIITAMLDTLGMFSHRTTRAAERT